MEFKNFGSFADLKYGISKKPDGPMELAGKGLSNIPNRRKFYGRLGIDESRIINPRQTHSARVIKVDPSNAGKTILDADGLVTSNKGVVLTVTAADCFPVYFFDAVSKIVGLAHCGWRGILGELPAKVLLAMGSNPANIFVGVGPGIGPCHFEIQSDILEDFNGYLAQIELEDCKIFIDLPGIIARQLRAAGVPERNIENCGECTFCHHEKYFSFRRDKPAEVETMLAYIGLL